MLFLAFVGYASATHVATYDTNVAWTKPPFMGLESLSVDPAVFVQQLQPLKAPLAADVEPLPNQAATGDLALVFTNPQSSWAKLSLNSLPIGTLGPYAQMRLEGLKPGLYSVTLEVPTRRVRTFAVRVGPNPRIAPPIRVAVSRDRLELSDNIYFDLDSAAVLEESFGLLDEVAKALGAHAEALVVRIEGHTDSRGEAEYNQKLSDARASAVRDYLIKAGVVADRLVSAGFGESKPLDAAETEAAWDQNRRVAFLIEKHAEDVPPPAPVLVAPAKKGRRGK